MKAIMEILDRVAVSSLPEGDVDMLHSQSYDIVPLKGHSIRRPWYHQELVSSSEFRGKILLLPDVGKFEIELKAFDPALLANGICSRYPSDITIYKNRNRRINRYLVYVQYRMFSLRKNQIAFWCFSQTLIRKSHSYLVACMHSVDRNIYRKKTLKELRMLLLRLNRMRGQFCTIGTQFGRQHLTTNHGHEKLSCALMSHYLKFYRVYIPKTEVKYRPLGVPTLAWRIFQKMWLSPILNYTSMHLPEDFHGYIPRRGCGTAWKSILKNTIHSANIYEVDFSNFFPSVDSDHLLDFMLNKWAIATPVAVYLYMLNQSLPIFLEAKSQDRVHGEIRFTPAHQDSLISDQAKKLAFKLPEARRNIQDLSLAGLADMDPYFQEKELLKDYSQPEKPLVVKENIFSKGNQLSYAEGNTRAWIEAQRVTPFDPNRKLREKLGFQFKGNIGLPQGGTLSPYLSIMYLEEVFQKLEMPSDVKFVFYADDGLFYSDNKASLEAWINRVSKLDKSPGTLSYFNIRVNFEKSSWVKVDNIWKHPLKFLGLVFVPGKSIAESKLVASTRKGSTLEYSKELQELTSFEYSEYLINMKNSNFVEAKLKALNSLPDSRLTRVVKLYYESVLEIQKWNIKPSYLSYAYYLQKLVGSRPEHFIHQLFEGLINLNFPEGYSEYFKIFSENSQFDQKLITFDLDSATAEDMFGHYLPHLESILYSPNSISRHVAASRLLLRKSVSLPIPDSSFVRPESVDSSIMKEVGKGVVSLFQLDVNIDDINPTSTVLKGQAVDPHPYIFLHSIFDTLKILSLRVNKFINPLPNDLYILRYFHKKYQFSNLIKSKYFGLILSRMYIGSLTLEEFSQDFEFGYVKDSLADYLDVKSSRDDTLNIFTGSSYATREMVRLSSFLGLQSKFERDFTGALFTSRPHQRFVLFQEGILPPDSWDR